MEFTGFTIFHVFRLIGSIGGACLGAWLGLFFGVGWAIVGGIVGLFIGTCVGILPEDWAHQSMMKELKEASNEKLRTMIARPEWRFDSTMALLQLAAREENVDSEFPRILNMLESDSVLTRRFGWDAMRIVFTDKLNRIENYDPKDPTERCRAKVNKLRNPDFPAQSESQPV